MKPNLLGIGAQKCASTWVYRVLEEHPDVCMSDPKELDFFSFHYHFGFRWYESHFTAVKPVRIAGEISPSYLCDAMAAERAFAYNPGFRVVVTLRDPVERMFSNHLHEIRLGHIGSGTTFEEGLENNPMYFEQSRYGHYLSSWFRVFPREQILVLFQEEVEKNPLQQAERLESFLGLSHPDERSAVGRRSNRSEAARLAWLESLFKGAGKMMRRIGLAPLVDRLRAMSWVDSLRQKNKVHLSGQVPQMLPETREKLIGMLEKDVSELSQLLGDQTLPWLSRYAMAARDQSEAGL